MKIFYCALAFMLSAYIGEIVNFIAKHKDPMGSFFFAIWVTRAKSNMSYTIIKKFKPTIGSIILDAEIELDGYKSGKDYPHTLRLIITDILRDGKLVRMEFITDNFDFAASTICDLYKGRWDIELFFKQLKQTLKLSDFLGYDDCVKCFDPSLTENILLTLERE